MSKKKRRKDLQLRNRQSFEYDIRPPAGILNVFSRLNYKVHYAIAEFVDNSTQSYLLHSAELNSSELNYHMIVKIDYDADARVLTITDNAFGMERERFLDAITLDAKNSDQVNSRNEFGMGLKTAASWFGNVWSVTSTAYGSPNQYFTEIDIPKLQNTGANDIVINISDADPEEHGTIIKISQITKGIGPRTIGKIRSLLASMYRRDLIDGKIEILFNGSNIIFENYPVLKFREQEWKKSLDFSIDFGGREYRTTGFVGIMNPGSFPKAGFALFRRNRVVIGGEDQNYKPQEIFGQAQSQVSLKLFGELNMDDYPVNQAKDGFIWDDGLEDEFIFALKSNIREYIDIARLSSKERVAEECFSEDASARVASKVEQAIDSAFNDNNEDITDIANTESTNDDLSSEQKAIDDVTQRFKAELKQNDLDKPDSYVGTPRLYTIPIDKVTTKEIEVSWMIGRGEKWIAVTDKAERTDVVININHPFFKPYSNEEEFQSVLEEFVIAFVVAEEQAKSVSDRDGYIYSSAIRENMNNLLYKLGEHND